MKDDYIVGLPTEREKELIIYLLNAIANWIKIHETKRSELITTLFHLLYIVFDKQSILDLDGKLKEIDNFCYVMKEKIKGTVLEELNSTKTIE